MTTFGVLKQRVRESASLTTSDNTTVADFVNDGYRDLCRDARLIQRSFSVSYLAIAAPGTGKPEYAVALADLGASYGGVFEILQLSVGKPGDVARSVTWAEDLGHLRELAGTSGYSGQDVAVALVEGDQLLLWPNPELSGVSLQGYASMRPLAMTNDALEPTYVAPEYHRAIYYRAMQLAIEWDRQGDQDAAAWEGRYRALVGDARRAQARSRRSRAMRPSVSSGGMSRGWPDGPWGKAT